MENVSDGRKYARILKKIIPELGRQSSSEEEVWWGREEWRRDTGRWRGRESE